MKKTSSGVSFLLSISCLFLLSQTILSMPENALPWINLSGPVSPEPEKSGEVEATMISMASGDFDKDGYPDLVCGHANGDAFAITFRKAEKSISPDSIPFPSVSASLFIDTRPDFLATGDMDNDGHRDIVCCERGGEQLILIPGDGNGGFGDPEEICLNGHITAFTTGEFNRRDGLVDIACAVSGEAGSELLVYEDPRGAWLAEPEITTLPGEAGSISSGNLNDDFMPDLAVGGKGWMIILEGRDRNLYARGSRKNEVLPPRFIFEPTPFNIQSVAIGDFFGEARNVVALLDDSGVIHVYDPGKDKNNILHGPSLAESSITGEGGFLLACYVSSLPGKDLIVGTASGGPLTILDRRHFMRMAAKRDPRDNTDTLEPVTLSTTGKTRAVLPLRLNGDALCDLVIAETQKNGISILYTKPLTTFTVDSPDKLPDENPGNGICDACLEWDGSTCLKWGCTLHAAIQEANASPGLDDIRFSLSSIDPVDAYGLPDIEEAVDIDGGTLGNTIIQHGSYTIDFFKITSGSHTTIKNLVISGGSNCITLGGSGHHIVESNYIGTDELASERMRGQCGVLVTSPENLIGGMSSDRRNVFGSDKGVHIEDFEAHDNLVWGNYFGLQADGDYALKSSGGSMCTAGVRIEDAPGNQIGGTEAGKRNVILTASWPIHVTTVSGSPSSTCDNLIQGNYIGTNKDGDAVPESLQKTADIIIINRADRTTIGGTAGVTSELDCSGACNLIANGEHGIQLTGSVMSGNKYPCGAVIQGNFIGTDKTGMNSGDFGIKWNGITVGIVQGTTIGGDIPDARNVISGCGNDGIKLTGDYTYSSTDTLIIGNYIGVDALSAGALANTGHGIHAPEPVFGPLRIGGGYLTTPGGELTGEGNLISGNLGDGINLFKTTNAIIRGNFIGTNSLGNRPIGNGGFGITASGKSKTIGGDLKGEGNLISGNGKYGLKIYVNAATHIQGNLVGTDTTGLTAIGNQKGGMEILNAAEMNGGVIGGDSPRMGNVISGSLGDPALGEGFGICLHGTRHMKIQGNKIGTDITGDKALPNSGHGILLLAGSQHNIIGGGDISQINTISGNGGSGIFLQKKYTHYNKIQGNNIGVNHIGEAALGNQLCGIEIEDQCCSNTIGGKTVEIGFPPGNIISGNKKDGISIYNSRPFASGQPLDINEIQGNIIGLDANHDPAGNGESGVHFRDFKLVYIGGENFAGGTGKYAGNIIAGQTRHGILIEDEHARNFLIQGNYIGTDDKSKSGIGNGGDGIRMTRVTTEEGRLGVIGGTSSDLANIISGNTGSGIRIDGSGIRFGYPRMQNPVIEGNLIGTSINSSISLPNKEHGIYLINSEETIIGSTKKGGSNVISGNEVDGIRMEGSKDCVILGNFIGMDESGYSSVPNKGEGIANFSGSNIQIGGDTPEMKNVISGNGRNGILITGSIGSNHRITGNHIGIDIDGSNARPNTLNGIRVENGAKNFQIGGNKPGEENVIAGNKGWGVEIRRGELAGDKQPYNIAVVGNYIGLFYDSSKDETTISPNELGGVLISDAIDNTIGGSIASDRNIISGNGGDGIQLAGENSTGNAIYNNFIGTDPGGTLIQLPDTLDKTGNTGNGIHINGAPSVQIGGPATLEGNVISGNLKSGISIQGEKASGTTIVNNLIGLDKDGFLDLGNTSCGIKISGSPGTIIGGVTRDLSNAISGNGEDGISISGMGATGTTIKGNVIGADYDGLLAVPNDKRGILVDNTTGSQIGGTEDGAGNLVSGNKGAGMEISGKEAGNTLIQSNLIGTNINGTGELLNIGGIVIDNAPNTRIGPGNLISGNDSHGVSLKGADSEGTTLSGNFIGTNKNGDAALANQGNGVHLELARGIVIGGTNPEDYNLVSGNKGNGINLSGDESTRAVIRGNRIGTDRDMLHPIPNGENGILLVGAGKNTIGGSRMEHGNIIGGNLANGIRLSGIKGKQNLVFGNQLGLHIKDGVSSPTKLANAKHGIYIEQGASENTIGGDSFTSGNVIAYNGLDGIYIASGNKNRISRNSIFENSGLGIDLGENGQDTNDDKDPDTGANQLQNYPVLNNATYTSPNLAIIGNLNSIPEKTFEIQFYANDKKDPSGFGEGGDYIGSIDVTTDTDGNAAISAGFSYPYNAAFITATAIDENGNTSEFSAFIALPSYEEIMIREYLLGLRKLTPEERKTADVNGDGKIDVADLVALNL